MGEPWESEWRDYFDLMGVTPDASPEDLRKAWHRGAKKCHPDRNPQDPKSATESFQILEEAYRVLSSPELREPYLAAWRTRGEPPEPEPPPPPSFSCSTPRCGRGTEGLCDGCQTPTCAFHVHVVPRPDRFFARAGKYCPACIPKCTRCHKTFPAELPAHLASRLELLRKTVGGTHWCEACLLQERVFSCARCGSKDMALSSLRACPSCGKGDLCPSCFSAGASECHGCGEVLLLRAKAQAWHAAAKQISLWSIAATCLICFLAPLGWFLGRFGLSSFLREVVSQGFISVAGGTLIVGVLLALGGMAAKFGAVAHTIVVGPTLKTLFDWVATRYEARAQALREALLNS